MRKFEVAGLLFVLVLLAYRIFIGIQLQVVLSVVITLLSIFYLWFGFFIFNRLGVTDLFSREKRSNLSALQITVSITAGILYSFSFIAIMFAVGFFPGMKIMIGLTLLLNLIFLGFSIFVVSRDKAKSNYMKQFLWRSTFLVALFFALWFIPVDKRLNTLYKNHPSFVEAFNDYLDDPDNPEVQNRLREERSAFR